MRLLRLLKSKYLCLSMELSSGASRMFVLGLLARHGPLHGHALRQMAHQDHTELWTDVKVGPLYSAIRQLSAEGLLAAQRTEQVGRLPTRTVYAITEAGRRELEQVRRAVLLDAQLRPDPFDLALALSDQAPGQDLTEVVRQRKDAIQAEMEARRRLKAKAWPHLSGPEREVFSHYQHRYQAELDWHDELLERLALNAHRAGAGSLGGPNPTRPPGPVQPQPEKPTKGARHLGTGQGAPIESALPALAASTDRGPQA